MSITKLTESMAQTEQSTGELSLEQQLAYYRAENEMLKAREAKRQSGKRSTEDLAHGLTVKVSQKGALSIYGCGRFPFTFYLEQAERIFDDMTVRALKCWIEENRSKLKTKEQAEKA